LPHNPILLPSTKHQMSWLTLEQQAMHRQKLYTPDTWTCKTNDGCGSSPLTTELIWHEVPDGKFVAFYETSNCHVGNKFSFISSKASGHHFMGTSPKAIRSFMTGDRKNLTRGPSTIEAICPKERANARVLNETDGSAWGSVAEDGLSSNWSDVLPGALSN